MILGREDVLRRLQDSWTGSCRAMQNALTYKDLRLLNVIGRKLGAESFNLDDR